MLNGIFHQNNKKFTVYNSDMQHWRGGVGDMRVIQILAVCYDFCKSALGVHMSFGPEV